MAQEKSGYSLSDFIPLACIIAGVALATYIKVVYTESYWMHDFMGFFFLVFGGLKAYNLRGFAGAFASYDFGAAYLPGYAYLYPFIELALGVCYLCAYYLWYTNIITLSIMLFGALGVGYALYRGRALECACLGMVFVVPMTYVTLIEDLLMAAMAGYMLLS